MALGAYDATPLDMAAAYTCLPTAACGFPRCWSIRCATPRAMSSQDFNPEKRQVLDPRIAFVMTNMMEGVMNFGTAIRRYVGRGFHRSSGGKNRQFARWLVCRLHQQPALHRLGWVRRLQRHAPERRADGGADLGRVHEEGGGAAAVFGHASRSPSPRAWSTCSWTRPPTGWQPLLVPRLTLPLSSPAPSRAIPATSPAAWRILLRIFGLGDKPLPPPPPGAQPPANGQAAADADKKKKGLFGKIVGIFKEDKSSSPPSKPPDSGGTTPH